MKTDSRYWAGLILALTLLGVPVQLVAQTMPMPPHVQKCFEEMNLYKQYFIYRGAGLSFDEIRITNDFSIRVIRFLATKNDSVEVPPGIEEKLETMATEVYGLAEEDFMDPAFQQRWEFTKMNECIENSAPTPLDINPHRRMIPDKSA
jgi:hypothetical protein